MQSNQKETRSKGVYSRKITFPSGLGDWTTIPFSMKEDHISIGTPSSSTFDSLSETDLKHIHTLHYALSENMLAVFSENLKSITEFNSITINQYLFSEFNQNFNTKMIQVNLSLRSLGTIHLIIPTEFANILINRLCGGDESATSRSNFTELEKTLIQTQIEEFIPLFPELWNNIFLQEDLSIEIIYDTYQIDQKASEKDLFTAFDIHFNFANHNNQQLTIVYPNKLLKTLIQFSAKATPKTKKHVFLNAKTVSDMMIPVIATLGKTKLVVNDIVNLQLGDIVILDNPIDKPISIKLGENVEIKAQPGKINKKYSIQLLTSPIHLSASKTNQSASQLFPTESVDETADQDIKSTEPENSLLSSESIEAEPISNESDEDMDIVDFEEPEDTAEDISSNQEEEDMDFDTPKETTTLDDAIEDQANDLDDIETKDIDTVEMESSPNVIENTEATATDIAVPMTPPKELPVDTPSEKYDTPTNAPTLDSDDDFSWDDLDDI